MRPLKLTMQAFESYLEPQVIDFESLNLARIFLVTGKTGAGKTTIFDAILYALYGSLSSEGRNKAKQIKTMVADSQNYTCEVILEFEQNGKTYRVTRIPAQTMPGAKKGKTKTTNSETVVLENLSDTSEVIPSKNAQDYLNRLLGLDEKQFRQVCLISQGSFSEVLTANTTEKKRIFRDLFGTGVFDDFVSQLENEVKSRESERLGSVNALDQLYHTVRVKDEDAERKNQIQDHQERLTFLEERKEAYEKESEELKNQIQELAGKQDTLLLEENNAVDYEDNLKRQEELIKSLLLRETEYQKKQSELQEKTKQKPEMEKKREELNSLQNQQKEYLALEEIKNNLSHAGLDLAKKQEKEKNTNSELQALVEKNNKDQQNLQKTEESLRKENEISIAYTNAAHKKKELKEEKENTASLQSDIRDNLPFSLKQLEQAKEEERKAKECSDQMEASYFASVTGILADKLAEGKPCPVCGSVSHPHPHLHTKEEVTEEQYKKAGQASKKAQEKRYTLQTSLEHLDENIRSELEKMKVFLEKQGVHPEQKAVYSASYDGFLLELQELINQNDKECRELSLQMEEFSRLHLRQDGLKKQILKDTENISEMKEILSSLSGEIIRLETEVTNLTEKLAEKKKGLAYESKSEADRRISALNDSIVSFDADLDRINNEVLSAKEQSAEMEGRLKIIKERVDSYHGRERESVTAELMEVREIRKNLDHSYSELVSCINSVENIKNEYQAGFDSFEKKNHEYSLYRNLLNVFKGKNTEDGSPAKSVDLETFVLARYLDDIIRFANQRLVVMSDGRYQMERRTDGFKGGGQQGLDIDIVDQYTMERRQAGTLSGGETFMASLSLALGLSDKVRMMTSQKDIDVLFVDEGFGSLDQEALRRAADTLRNLASSDRKTIGLISHVEDLSTYFEKQLIVVKDPDGHSKVIYK